MSSNHERRLSARIKGRGLLVRMADQRSAALNAGEAACAPELNTLPFVSVIMPVRNEAKYIQRSLESVLRQDYPKERLEIIVADGQSTDNTREIVSSYQQTNSNVLLIDNPQRIVAAGLNRAVREARGEIIVRVDGHCEIPSNYVTTCVQHLCNGYQGVGGSVESAGENQMSQAISVAMSSIFGVGNSSFRTTSHTIVVDTIPFPAYRRSLIELAGPYDEELVRNQDDEYNFRLRKLGARLLLIGNLRCKYYIRRSLTSLWNQYFQYGYWKVRIMQKHPLQMRPRHFAPALFILMLISSLLLSPISLIALASAAVISATYLLMLVVSCLLCLSRLSVRQLPFLVVSFATLHFSYGCGFLQGLWHFRNRWRQ